MGFWSRLVRGERALPYLADGAALTLADQGPTFDVNSGTVPSLFFGLTSYADPVSVAPRVSRTVAMQVPSIKRCLDLTSGAAGRIPFVQLDRTGQAVVSPLLSQPEPSIPRSITMMRTITDLLLEGTAWWLITRFDWQGRPASVVRLDPRTVSVTQEGRVYYTLDGNSGEVSEWVPDQNMIRFDSPSEPILSAGARAIRTLLLLDKAAENSADGVPPQDYFTPTEDVDPATDEDITEILDAWGTARKARRTAYVPAALKYNVNAGFSPEQLQLIESRQHAVTEIARLFGIDAEELGIPTTSRTYFNAYDRRKNFVDFTLGPLLSTIEDRLSMDDVTLRGNHVRADLDVLLRSDPATRMAIATQGVTSGVMTLAEARMFFDSQLPEVGGESQAIDAPADQPAQPTGVPA
ncbi:MAG: phage portal protein [Nocardioidaceae bacterium]